MHIRDACSDDLPFLREILYTAAFWRPDGDHPPMEWALGLPQLSIYHEGWGRPGDIGLVAEEDGTRIGAVYYRFFTEDEHGEGFVNAQIPELAIAVVDGQRGKGVGRALMQAIGDRAKTEGLERICLSVNDDNPAKRLYASLGYVDYSPGDGLGRMILKL